MSYRFCHEIHQNDGVCSEQIPLWVPGQGKPWQYCPRCGRPTGHLEINAGEFQSSHNTASDKSLRLQNGGVASVQVTLKLLEAIMDFTFTPNQITSFALQGGEGRRISFSVPALQSSTPLGKLLVQSSDAALDPEQDSWQTLSRVTRDTPVPLSTTVALSAKTHCPSKCLIFREGASRREIKIINVGGQPAEIQRVDGPVGYSWKAESSLRLDPKESVKLSIERVYRENVDDVASLHIHTTSGLHTVTLHNIVNTEKPDKYMAVVGIDFGTAFTSVAFRQCRNRVNLVDEVNFLRPPGESKDRFPTRLWIGKLPQSQYQYGTRATDTYEEDPSAGYLFREIKTLLRDDSEEPIHPEGEENRARARELVESRLGGDWRTALVTKYLSWLYQSIIRPEILRRFRTPNIPVKYVFSLPVLDSATERRLYERQYQRMKECVERAGFPRGSFEFAFEPVCASMGLIYPPRDSNWPRLGTADMPLQNQHIVVFDSGGGTTDVVLARVDVEGQGGNLQLRIERCLGVDSSAVTFGGEEVTTALLQALLRPQSVPTTTRWYDGAMNINEVLELPTSEPGEDDSATNDFTLSQRDKAETLKIALGKEGASSQQRGGTVIRPDIVTELIVEPLRRLTDELERRVFDLIPRDIPYYFCVGGNSSLGTFEMWTKMFMEDEETELPSQRRLSIPEKYRQLAVAYGSVFIPTARIPNRVPYDIRVKIDDTQMVIYPRNSEQEVLPTYLPYPIRPENSVLIQVEGRVRPDTPPSNPMPNRVPSDAGDEGWYILTQIDVDNLYGVTVQVPFVCDIQNGILKVEGVFPHPGVGDDDEGHDENRTFLTYRL